MVEYWVVVTLSHSKISIHYNRADGEARFLAFPDNEWPAPLAVYVSGDSITLGRDALTLVRENAPGAYSDIFSLMRKPGSFSYCGEELGINRLLLCVVEHYLHRFLSRSMFGELGDLERNRPVLPLMFAFESDITVEEKTFVLSLFRNAGYAKVTALDHYRYIVDYARHIQSRSYTVVAESDGSSLGLSAYGRLSRRPLARVVNTRLGTDPRVDRTADIIWEGICLENPYLDKEMEFPRIRQIVINFLASGSSEEEDKVRLSDGVEYDYFLSRNTIANMRITDDSEFSRVVDDFMRSAGISKENTGLVLKGTLAGNDYFRNRLSPHFSAVEQLDAEALSCIHTNMVSALRSGQERGEEIPVTPKVQTPPPPPSPPPVVETKKTKDIPSASESRGKKPVMDVDKLRKDVLGFLRKGNIEKGKQFFNDARALFSSEAMHTYASDFSHIRDLIKRYSSEKASVDPMQGHLLYRQKRAYLKSALRNGDSTKALSLIAELESELHGMNFHEYDSDLNSFRQEAEALRQGNAVSAPSVSRPPVAASTGNPARDALVAGDYEKAKALFASAGDSKMERNAVSLQRLSKVFEIWERESAAICGNGDTRRAKQAIAELATYRSLLRRCELDATPVTSLIEKFKKV